LPEVAVEEALKEEAEVQEAIVHSLIKQYQLILIQLL
jgi:hypothetical protein